jgi:flagellar basal-body rod modification protein FlgD
MKYQDPLEPTSNTEYISQFATFSELEEIQNMSASTDIARASSLVGKEVIMKVTSETTGNTDYINGKVDYVVIESGKAYLSIENSLYSIDDLDTVVDEEYLEAYNLATDISSALEDLPTIANVTLSNQTAIEKLQASYDALTDYQKTFVSATNLTAIKNYTAKLKELLTTESTTSTTDETTTE